jgi:hypothetical protein
LKSVNRTARRDYFKHCVTSIFKDKALRDTKRVENLKRLEEKEKYEQAQQRTTSERYSFPPSFPTKAHDLAKGYYHTQRHKINLIRGGYLEEKEEDPDRWNLSKWNVILEYDVRRQNWPKISQLRKLMLDETIHHFNLDKLENEFNSEVIANAEVQELYRIIQGCKLTPQQIEEQKKLEEEESRIGVTPFSKEQTQQTSQTAPPK